MVPSNIRKAICGWASHSCKVITLKMKETEIGNCGSKSINKFINKFIVKEQQVNGSLFFKLQLKNIRWTLMGFKRNYQIRILSNQLKIIFFFIYSLFIIILINNFILFGLKLECEVQNYTFWNLKF